MVDKTNYIIPNIFVSIIQCFSFIISYVIIYFLVGIICLTIADFISNISFLALFLKAFPVNDTIAYTLLPISSYFLIYSFNNFVFKKYYFNNISTIIFFVFLSWLTVDHIIKTASKYGIISWDFANWIWSDVLFIALVFASFGNRTQFLIEKSKVS